MSYEEFLMQKYKAELEFKKSTKYKVMKVVAIIGFIITVVGSWIILFMWG